MFSGSSGRLISPPSPPAPSPGTFMTKASLETAVRAYNSNPTAAIATYGPIANWDMGAITDMSYLFYNLKNFNADISSWDTSSVTTMFLMFYRASGFNQVLSFDTSKVTTMYGMFNRASVFNQPLSFDTSSVTNMERMFQFASAFNQLLSFDTAKVTTMAAMFSFAVAFNQPLSFDTSSVTAMDYMFSDHSLSDANKLLIRCAWAGTSAFASAGYGSSWGPGTCA